METNSKMYPSFICLWILQKEVIFGHFSADDISSEKHHMNDCLILENGSGDIMEKQNKAQFLNTFILVRSHKATGGKSKGYKRS